MTKDWLSLHSSLSILFLWSEWFLCDIPSVINHSYIFILFSQCWFLCSNKTARSLGNEVWGRITGSNSSGFPISCYVCPERLAAAISHCKKASSYAVRGPTELLRIQLMAFSQPSLSTPPLFHLPWLVLDETTGAGRHGGFAQQPPYYLAQAHTHGKSSVNISWFTNVTRLRHLPHSHRRGKRQDRNIFVSVYTNEW